MKGTVDTKDDQLVHLPHAFVPMDEMKNHRLHSFILLQYVYEFVSLQGLVMCGIIRGQLMETALMLCEVTRMYRRANIGWLCHF
jgi:hypothetical protein